MRFSGRSQRVFAACGLVLLLGFPTALVLRTQRAPSQGDAAPPLISEYATGGSSTTKDACASGEPRYLLFVDAGCPACTSHLELLALIVDSLDENDREVVRSRIRVIEHGADESSHARPFDLPADCDPHETNFKRYGVTSVPTGFFIQDGVVAGSHIGGIGPAKIDTLVQWLAGFEGMLDRVLGDTHPDGRLETAHRSRSVELHRGEDS